MSTKNDEEEYLVPSEEKETYEYQHPMGFLNRYSYLKKSNMSTTTISGKRKSFIVSVYEKLGKASLAASIYNLSATAVGAGVLSLPYALRISGIGFGTICLILGALSSLWTLTILTEGSKFLHVGKDFAAICQKAGGKPLSFLFDWSIMLQVFGTQAIYQIIAQDLFNRSLLAFGVSSEWVNSPLQKGMQTLITSCVVLYPMCVMKTLSALSYASLLSILTIAYTALVLVIEMPFYFQLNYNTDKNKMDYFILNWDLLDAISMSYFAYSCNQTFFIVYDELSDNTVPRIQKVLRISIVINMALFVLIALSGYLSTFRETDKVVVTRDILDFWGERDYFIIFAMIGIYLTVIISVPINYVALRRSAFNAIWSRQEKIKYNTKNFLFTFIMLAATTCVALYFPYIVSLMSIIGGAFGVNTDYIIPTIIYLRAVPGRKIKKILSVLYCIMLSSFGYAAVVYTTYNIAIGNQK